MIATRCAAVRNCCAAFSYELRGRAAAQLRGNIGSQACIAWHIWDYLAHPKTGRNFGTVYDSASAYAGDIVARSNGICYA